MQKKYGPFHMKIWKKFAKEKAIFQRHTTFTTCSPYSGVDYSRRAGRVSHRCWEHRGGGSSKFDGGGGLKSIHGGSMGGI